MTCIYCAGGGHASDPCDTCRDKMKRVHESVGDAWEFGACACCMNLKVISVQMGMCADCIKDAVDWATTVTKTLSG